MVFRRLLPKSGDWVLLQTAQFDSDGRPISYEPIQQVERVADTLIYLKPYTTIEGHHFYFLKGFKRHEYEILKTPARA